MKIVTKINDLRFTLPMIVLKPMLLVKLETLKMMVIKTAISFFIPTLL